MSQFRPPSQPGWGQPDQQPFPPQQPPYTPPTQPQQYEQWQQQPPAQPLPMQSTDYYPWPQQQADVPPQQQQWPQQSQQPSYTQPGQYQQPQFFQTVTPPQPKYPPAPGMFYPPVQTPLPPVPPHKRMPRNEKIALWTIGSIIGVFALIVAFILASAASPQGTSLSQADQSATTVAANSAATNIAQEATAVSASNAVTPTGVTPTPTQAAPTPTPVVTQKPAPTFVTFGDGNYQVGTDIKPGTYRTQTGSPGCYFERLKGFSGSFSDIIANSNTDYPAIVTILSSDKGFSSQSCGTWTSDLSQITTSKTTFDDGMYIVGVDMVPGTYKNTASQHCYYARLSGFGNSFNDILANNNTDAAAIVTIFASDKGFESSNCGTWTKI